MSPSERSAAVAFENIVASLNQALDPDLCLTDLRVEKEAEPSEDTNIAWRLNSAFLISLCGKSHPAYTTALRYLERLAGDPAWGQAAAFYRQGFDLLPQEIAATSARSTAFRERLVALEAWFSEQSAPQAGWELAEHIWGLFHPEAAGIRGHETARVMDLRQARTVRVTEPNPEPIADPAREMVFTGNVLLTLPPASRRIDELELAPALKHALRRAANQEQQFWYDHPIQIGVEPAANEALYGLRGLAQAYRYEFQRSGNAEAPEKLIVLLSVSTTHPSLHAIAKAYLEGEFKRAGDLYDLDVYVFTEADARRLVSEVLAPAAKAYLGDNEAEAALEVFGVDGEYGRHYTFLKAIAAFWQVFIRPEVKGTFKIDLDQVFPQEELIEQTGGTAFDHFRTPLWGARGLEADGKPVELGLIAGALVNEADIEKSLFTPDVPFPEAGIRLNSEEHIFFSRLPQALSTQAEMMTRYSSASLDGERTCLQRVHVTGGTNGILFESLRRHRPFTPTFIGRAEDQAYILSVFAEAGERLAYLHAAGLIMRHDKEEFAQEAIRAARTGRQIGDLVRTLYFSAYARALDLDFDGLKSRLAPFTGSFISEIPITLVYLRFALQVASLHANGSAGAGLELVRAGARRLSQALTFTRGNPSPLQSQYQAEQTAWELYYRSLAAVERGLGKNEPYAQKLRSRAISIIQDCRVTVVS